MVLEALTGHLRRERDRRADPSRRRSARRCGAAARRLLSAGVLSALLGRGGRAAGGGVRPGRGPYGVGGAALKRQSSHAYGGSAPVREHVTAAARHARPSTSRHPSAPSSPSASADSASRAARPCSSAAFTVSPAPIVSATVTGRGAGTEDSRPDRAPYRKTLRHPREHHRPRAPRAAKKKPPSHLGVVLRELSIGVTHTAASRTGTAPDTRPRPGSEPALMFGSSRVKTPRPASRRSSASYAVAPGSSTSEQVPNASARTDSGSCGRQLEEPVGAALRHRSRSGRSRPGAPMVATASVVSSAPRWGCERFRPRRTQPGQQTRRRSRPSRHEKTSPTDAPSRPSATAVLYGPPPSRGSSAGRGAPSPCGDQVDQVLRRRRSQART